jgi:tetratricopeptide (TPR) repeat protein
MIKILGTLGSAYLFQKKDCTSGINYYEQVLEFDENNCEAIQSLGFAYFGEDLCSTNYTRALSYFNRALSCWTTKGDAKCQHVDLMLWIAQAYHFRAVEKSEAKDKEGSQADYARADEWYQEVLKCDPGNQPAKDGQRQVQWEH